MADIPESTKLLPCPFCGGEGDTFRPTCDQRTPYDPTDRAYPVARCRDCYAEVPGKNWDDSCRSAIAAWNTRAAPPAMDREAVEKVEGLNSHVVARIKHVLQTVANYANAERNGGEFADDLRRDIACMNGDVVADDLAQFTAALSTLSADAIRQGEGGWKAEMRDFASLMVDEVIAKTRVQLDAGEGLSVADQRLLLEQLIVERKRHALATPASHASDGGKA